MSLRRALCASLALITLIPSLAFGSTTLTTSAASSNAIPINPYNQADVSLAVAQYFADIPVMYEIAKCESNFTQYGSSGNVLNGGSGGMLGVFQINGAVHKSFAQSLGDDITTLAGNMAYARYLYDNEGGTGPWTSSEDCWSGVDAASAVAKIIGSAANSVVSAIVPSVASASTSASTPAIASLTDSTTTSQTPSVPAMPDIQQVKTSTVSASLTSNLKLGSTGTQVKLLQQLLNAAGFKVAKSGAGSPGQESTTFGPATKAAVERFQCAQNIVCKGSESSTGYGYVGAKTRAALNS